MVYLIIDFENRQTIRCDGKAHLMDELHTYLNNGCTELDLEDFLEVYSCDNFSTVNIEFVPASIKIT